jgi:PAS domain S-box-containing protein
MMKNVWSKNLGKKTLLTLALVFIGMFIVTAIFEIAIQWLLPEVNIRQLDLMTLIFASIGATFIAYFPIRSLKTSEAYINSILNGSPVLQFVIDTDHRVFSWNHAMEVYSRIPASDIIGTSNHWKALYHEKRPCLADLLVDGDIEHLQDWYQGKIIRSALISNAYESVGVYDVIGEKEIWFYFTAAPIRNEDGVLIGAVETLIDITQRKQGEIALDKSKQAAEESLALFTTLFENAPIGFVFFDPDFRLVHANKLITEISGVSRKESIGRNIEDLIPRNWPFGKKQYQEVFKTGIPMVGIEATTESGPIPVMKRHWLASLYPVKTESGKILGVGSIIIEVTDLKKAGDALRESNERFLAFISEAAMRLKNPLEVVEENLGLMVMDIEAGEMERPAQLLALKLQMKNLEQIRQNIIDLNAHIVEHNDELSPATKQFLTG